MAHMDIKLLKLNIRGNTTKHRSNFIAFQALLQESQLSARQEVSNSLLTMFPSGQCLARHRSNIKEKNSQNWPVKSITEYSEAWNLMFFKLD